MLFEELDRIKRDVVMGSVALMFCGAALLMTPEAYLPLLGDAIGFVLLVRLALSILAFLERHGTLMSYLRLSGGLALGALGLALLTFDGFFLATLRWLVGTLPILIGVYGMFHALAFARRSGRRGWWVLIVLSGLLLAFGTMVFWNPWAYDVQAAVRVVGGSLVYSSLVSALSLVWIWPVRADGGEA